ncbi:hypothetical protein AAGU66_06020 [Edwardsiella ictaluri]|nr:hypothetical protein [Edwardsiella ictaluri]ELV7526369.1 hypothetical protein [Edwardsiella ictaluri]QPW29720.1 hypothetical protein F8539_06660 [Edwardsiella ictaluri]UYB62840.1 hypothetical protein N8I66_06635 [Edwardsiella ictaluri]UYB66066.1 hypothetical protein N8I67_06630 [Edwardsiella ictaluri]WFN95894.1 hypothetical protein MAY91_13720 [Edwardsiella ictaluri]
MLLVLDSPRELSMEQLLSEVAMPLREIGEAKDALRRKGWVAPVGGYYRLTGEGKAQAAMLRDIASHQQQQVVAGFSVEEIALLQKILRAIPRACQTLSPVME